MRRLRPIGAAILVAVPLLLTGGRLADYRPGPDERYWDYDEIQDQLAQWETEYQSIFHREVIGYTGVLGEPIWAVRISDNPQIDEPEICVMVAAAIGTYIFLPSGAGSGEITWFYSAFMLVFITTGIGNGCLWSQVL